MSEQMGSADASGPTPPASRPLAFDMIDLVGTLLRWWKLVAAGTLVGAALGIGYCIVAQREYVAEVVLLPRESQANSGLLSQLGQLGGLASLVGVNVPKGRDESLAVLRSRAFVAQFIETQGIAPELQGASRPMFAYGDRLWDVNDAVGFFEDNVREIYDDKKSGSVKITIRWSDPKVAAAWANAMAQQLNRLGRERAESEATRNIRYLKSELESARVIGLTESISRLLEDEMKRLMLARGTDDFLYRVVDPAVPPRERAWPRYGRVTVASAAGGFAFAFLLAVVLEIVRSRRSRR